MNRSFIFIFFIFFSNQTLFSNHIRYEDQVIVIEFDSPDFSDGDCPNLKNNGVIQEDVGWRGGCLLKTPFFHGFKSTEAEIQILIEFDGSWDGFTSNLDRALNFNLAKIILESFDELNFRHEVLRPLKAADFGSVHWLAEHPKGTFYYGATDGVKKLVLSPSIIPRSSKNISLNICEIAPNTRLKISKIEMRLKPVF